RRGSPDTGVGGNCCVDFSSRCARCPTRQTYRSRSPPGEPQFPLLISAVPLWSIDWSRTKNEEARNAWEDWLKRQDNTWDSIRDHPDRWQGIPAQRPHAGRCWFSDGGITSNFPVHLFDAPIPRWPTFVINLRPFHPDHPEAPQNQYDNVCVPRTNEGVTG